MSPLSRSLLAGAGILLAIGIALVFLAVLFSPAGTGTVSGPGPGPAGTTPAPAPVNTVSRTYTVQPTAPRTTVTEGVPVPVTTVPIRTPAPTTIPRPVDFSLDSGTPVSCGLTCRETVATVTNTGGETAHGVCVELSVHNSDGELIPVNGGDFMSECVGDLAPGASVSRTVQINADCGFLASRCVQKTLILSSLVRSRERVVTFPDSVMGG